MLKGNIVDLKNNLKKYLDSVLKGNTVTIMKGYVAIAKIVPIKSALPNKTKLGIGRGTAKVKSNLTDPFIPEADWEMLK